MAVSKSISGVIDKDGSTLSGNGFSVSHLSQGEYQIVFDAAFTAPPATVGSQVMFKSDGENPLDNVVFPYLAKTGFTAITGDSGGKRQDRAFAFISSL